MFAAGNDLDVLNNIMNVLGTPSEYQMSKMVPNQGDKDYNY